MSCSHQKQNMVRQNSSRLLHTNREQTCQFPFEAA